MMDDADTLTASGDVPGTLAYMPPERLAGERRRRPATSGRSACCSGRRSRAGTRSGSRRCSSAAKAIQEGAPPLATARPDLPRQLSRRSTARCRSTRRDRPTRGAARRRAARRSAAASARRRVSGTAPDRLDGLVRDRRLTAAAGVALAGVAAGLAPASLPFYPAGWAAVAARCGGGRRVPAPRRARARARRAGPAARQPLARARASPTSPSRPLWLAVFAREPRWGGLPALGALLGPIGALGLAPAAALRARSPVRRAVAAQPAASSPARPRRASRRGAAVQRRRPPSGARRRRHATTRRRAARAVVDLLVAHPGARARSRARSPPWLRSSRSARTRGRWAIAGFGVAIVLRDARSRSRASTPCPSWPGRGPFACP